MSCACCLSYTINATASSFSRGVSTTICAYNRLEEGVWNHYKRSTRVQEYAGGGTRTTVVTRENPPYGSLPFLSISCEVNDPEITEEGDLTGLVVSDETTYDDAWTDEDYESAVSWFLSTAGASFIEGSLWAVEPPLGGVKGWQSMTPRDFVATPSARPFGAVQFGGTLSASVGKLYFQRTKGKVPVNAHFTEAIYEVGADPLDPEISPIASEDVILPVTVDGLVTYDAQLIYLHGGKTRQTWIKNLCYVPTWLDS